jgi:N-acyltransferase family protein/GNAT domain-containint protein
VLTQPALPENLERDAVARLAAHARIDAKTTAALLALLPRIAARPVLEGAAIRASRRLVEGSMGSALSELADLLREETLGEEITLFYLLVALLEIPIAEERHRTRGVDAAISRATWADLAAWCHYLRKREGRLGMTLEMLAWSQHALTGRLFRVGSLQFELEGFSGPLRAYRHRTSGELALIAMPGVTFSHGRRLIAREPGPGTWTAGGTFGPGAVHGHRIDEILGTVDEEMVTLSPEMWEIVLCEQDPMLLTHIPADSRVSVHDFSLSVGDAFELFAKLAPGVRPKGVFGVGWLFDPQVRAFLPESSAANDLRALCSLYPGRISELNTVQRIFGPSATRASVVALPREGLSALQKAVADFLSVPENALCTRGGFILEDRLTTLIEAARRRDSTRSRAYVASDPSTAHPEPVEG